MPDFDLLGSLMRDLHQEFVKIYYLMLPVFFALAVAVTWIRSPGSSVAFVDILKRAVISTFLLAAFPEISSAIVYLADGVAERIDTLNSLETFVRMAQEKTAANSESSMSSLLMFNDLIVSTLVFLSYILVYCARYLTLAMYHFFWTFFTIAAPLLLLFNLFGATAQITSNLFKGMIEVACWKIVWAILGAMLAALSYGDLYLTEGSYIVIVVMNFIIALAMIMTPQMVKSLVGGGLQGMSSALAPATVAAMVAAPAKAAMAYSKARGGLVAGQSFVSSRLANYRHGQKEKRRLHSGY